MSTKSFIINLPIITGDQDRRRLRKSFSFGCNLQNAVMGGGWDRVLQMRATPEWQATRAMPKGRERTKAFRDLRVRFRLSEYDFHADVAMHRKASGRGHLHGINECQKHASRAWISVERHLYEDGSPKFISSRRGLHSVREEACILLRGNRIDRESCGRRRRSALSSVANPTAYASTSTMTG